MNLSKKLIILSKATILIGLCILIYIVYFFVRTWGYVIFDPTYSEQVIKGIKLLLISSFTNIISTIWIYYILKSLSYIIDKIES
ncbi:MAG: hypothetical protein WAO56_01980 [Miniphocaeibacter sp.]|uniref:hypothetical protein n=1 Tax=Miniphocaeibacter sp. TaxID=3100973 RepID=UPI00181B1678|nr:hypothetical protein [Gallicola sp.]